MDETTVALDPVLRKCWMKKGEQQRVPLPAKRWQSQTILGGYNWRQDSLSWSLPDQNNSEGVVAWLEQLLLRDFPTQFLVLVMDMPASTAAR